MSVSTVQDTRQINFSAPTAINTPVLGKDAESGLEFFNALSLNAIIRMIYNAAASTGWEIDIIRDGKVIRTIPSDLTSATLPGPIWAGFPLGINPGLFQVQIRQTTGTLSTNATIAYMVMDHPLGQ